MPNGYHLLLATSGVNPDSQAAAKSYWQAVELETRNAINKFVLSAAMVWLGSSLAVLLLGFGVVWVSRGFRPHA
jgi:hypothetical protein